MMKMPVRIHAEKTGNNAYLNSSPSVVNVGQIFTKGDLKEVSEEVGKYKVLNIPTKINKVTVEIITLVELIKKGDKVGSSEVVLLAKLGIRPFSYGLVVQMVYDNGSVFSPNVLDLTEDDLMEKFASGVSMVTSLALAISYPTLAAAPHMFLNAYKNVLVISITID
ncbi:large ribosomal subunit protein uL10-like [Malus domestica]|uniref:large ribosomal subunit protein uL10-like n=1 Tax=Malus domestica TaxID=3750 RepID=UPI0010A9A403|nr:60S acidic ribosomal protein P0-like [Malus domestica]